MDMVWGSMLVEIILKDGKCVCGEWDSDDNGMVNGLAVAQRTYSISDLKNAASIEALWDMLTDSADDDETQSTGFSDLSDDVELFDFSKSVFIRVVKSISNIARITITDDTWESSNDERNLYIERLNALSTDVRNGFTAVTKESDEYNTVLTKWTETVCRVFARPLISLSEESVRTGVALALESGNLYDIAYKMNNTLTTCATEYNFLDSTDLTKWNIEFGYY